MSNHMAQQAKTPYPGGVRMSGNLPVLMCLSLHHTVVILNQPPSLAERNVNIKDNYYDVSRLV